MSAAGKREALEAAVHAQLTRAWKYGLNPGGDRPEPYAVIMAAAETYANAAAGEALDELYRDRRQADRRAVLADAAGNCGNCGYRRTSANHRTLCGRAA